MLSALLQFHAAHTHNLAHEADAGPDEVCAAEVLQHGKRSQERSLVSSVTISLFIP